MDTLSVVQCLPVLNQVLGPLETFASAFPSLAPVVLHVLAQVQKATLVAASANGGHLPLATVAHTLFLDKDVAVRGKFPPIKSTGFEKQEQRKWVPSAGSVPSIPSVCGVGCAACCPRWQGVDEQAHFHDLHVGTHSALPQTRHSGNSRAPSSPSASSQVPPSPSVAGWQLSPSQTLGLRQRVEVLHAHLTQRKSTSRVR
eukprot:CAMPEP_0175165842 /NCGR_PEP_ID=MMETSP0087-20121206/27336_1 /TAXON_ID=136419 /ORGANISM="Unknown Unknown, Strain D1" /LENGTH=199 /DNA_ID=CAMNT_0016455315 /DNA_START=55 /DNA_END=651 /DNA_ORIENTATION=+